VKPVSFESQEKSLRELCASLLRDGIAEVVVGFGERSEVSGVAVPITVRRPEDAGRLSWNSRCVPGLAGYTAGREGTVALVAKPCDARAVVALIAERQLDRDKIYIIGMECAGMTDGDGAPLAACVECVSGRAPVFDAEITGAPDAFGGAPERREEDNSADRFRGEMDKCILCFSCRQACYGCYCETCFMDRGTPNWQPSEPDVGAKMTYHLGRAMHLAGRCVECGACENVCASGVNIRYLIKAVTDFIDGEYGFRAGMDARALPALQAYSADDGEPGFLGKS
jgi:ferredoxin